MSIESLNCPQCGAPLNLKPGQTLAACGYCNSSLRIEAATGMAAGALPVVTKAIEIDPVSSYAHHALGGMHWRLKRKQEAVSEFRTAVSLNPNNIEAQMALGVSQVRTEDFRGSIQTIRTINGLPNGKELRQYLADPDRSRERCQFLLSIGAGLAVILAGVWIWRRK